MEGKDNIKELFSQKLGNYEAKVNPELWAKISSQVAAGATTTAATGLSVFTKVAIGLGISAAAITTVVILATNKSEEIPVKKAQIEIKEVTKNSVDKSETDVTSNDQTTVKNDAQTENDVNPTKETSLVPHNFTPNPVYMPDDTGFSGNEKQDFEFNTMPTKGVDKVTDEQRTEPQIVEGVRYVDMTNYGSSPANTPEITPEVSTLKPEAVKRYVNVFTPNGDGKNDYFELESEGLTNFSVVVFDPKGDIVFQSEDPDFRWDGRAMKTGEIVESGNYMYMVSAYDSEGNPYPIYERLTIKR